MLILIKIFRNYIYRLMLDFLLLLHLLSLSPLENGVVGHLMGILNLKLYYNSLQHPRQEGTWYFLRLVTWPFKKKLKKCMKLSKTAVFVSI